MTGSDSDGHLLADLVEDGVHGTITIAPAVLIELIEGAAVPVDGVVRLTKSRRTGKAIPVVDSATAEGTGSWHAGRGIRVRVHDGRLDAEVSVAVHMGASVPHVAQQIQERVATTVERMLGMQTGPIAVHVVELQTEGTPS